LTVLPEEYAAALSCLTAPALLPGSATAPNSYAWQLGTIDAPHYGTPFKIVVGKGTHVRRTGREGGDRPLPAVLHRVRRHCRRFNRDQQRQGDVAVSSLVVGYERCRGGRRRTAHGNGVCRWSGLAGGVESLCQEQGRIPDRSGRPYVKELCRGLGYVHALPDLQLVHRDVSPPNVLLSYRGEIKLADSCSHRRHR
jgi:hypothetical protein